MNFPTPRVRRLSPLIIALARTGGLYAGDCETEINQARAEPCNVTTGDGEAFPVTNSESGNYGLTCETEMGVNVYHRTTICP